MNGKISQLYNAQSRRVQPRQKNPFKIVLDWIWKYEVWFEGTFGLGILETWEKVLICLIFLALSCLIWWSIYFHFPNHIRTVISRTFYYIFGTQSPTSSQSSTNVIQSIAEGFSARINASMPSYKAHVDL